MPLTERVYLDWVQVHRSRGTTVKKKGMLTTFISACQNGHPGKSIRSLSIPTLALL